MLILIKWNVNVSKSVCLCAFLCIAIKVVGLCPFFLIEMLLLISQFKKANVTAKSIDLMIQTAVWTF